MSDKKKDYSKAEVDPVTQTAEKVWQKLVTHMLSPIQPKLDALQAEYHLYALVYGCGSPEELKARAYYQQQLNELLSAKPPLGGSRTS